MMRKFLVFINPISGVGNKNNLRKTIIDFFSKRNLHFEITGTNIECDYSDLPARINNTGITDLVICGGDGTINNICGHLQGVDINIGIVPTGSGNGLALAAGIPKKTHAALEKLIESKATYIDAFRVNDKFGCMLTGLGFDAQVAHNFAAGSTRGLATYLKLSFREFFLAKSYSFNISTAEKSFDTDAFFISIANSNQFGNNITIAPRASLNDGLLDIVIAKKTHHVAFLAGMLKQIRFGRLSSAEDTAGAVQYFQTDRLKISNPNRAPLHIDGEPSDTAELVEIKVIPGAIRLLH